MSDDKKLNPYEILGDYTPFAVADLFSLPYSLAQAFKKLAFHGDGRLKDKERDYKEAAFSIKYAIENISKFHLQKTVKVDLIHDVMNRYANVFPNMQLSAYESAMSILFFAQNGSFQQLENALMYAKKAAKYASS